MRQHAFEVLGMWTLLAVVAGLCLGALIRKSEQIRLDELLDRLYSMMEYLQNSRTGPVNPSVSWKDAPGDASVPIYKSNLR